MKLCYLLIFAYLAVTKGSETQKTLHDGNNQFTARMFSEVVENNKGKSVILSAFSVIPPLTQLAVASVGQSHDEILNAVGFPDDATANDVFALIDKKFNSIQGIELKKACKFYIPLGYQVQDSFAALSRDVYHSEIANINFGDSQKSANEINAWVEDQTNHRIKDLVDPNSITADTRGILVNALYFKGSWKYPFQSYATETKEFHVNKKKTTQVDMMFNAEAYKYKQSNVLRSQILELPYDGDQASFTIILPNDVEGIGQLLDKLKDPNILDEETKDMSYPQLRAYVPKLKIETKTDLKDVLMKMNVTKLFGKEANLTKLLKTDEPLYISDAVQKAFIEINEDGSEAAAANVFVAPGGSFSFEKLRYVEFVADHPFAYFLKVQDEIIFSGVFYGS